MAAGDDDWDLSAVVRSCNSTSAADPNATAADNALSCLASLTFDDDDPNDVAFSLADIFLPKQPNGFHELHQAFMSFFPNPVVSSSAAAAADMPNPSSSTVQSRHFRQGIKPIRQQSDLGPSVSGSPALQQHHHHRHPPAPFPPDFPSSPMTQSHTPKSRKRKNQQKRTVCHVTEDNLSTDMWAWRKYGQKPIKGSPYPRNYYRCSSSKGCAARKQVERSNADPETFIITYTGDHTHPRPTHRNSLAGSSRNKPSTSTRNNPASGDPDQTSSSTTAMVGSCSSPASPATSLNEDAAAKETSGGEKEAGEMFDDMAAVSSDDDDEDILIPNLAIRDEIFVGFEELGCSPNRRPS